MNFLSADVTKTASDAMAAYTGTGDNTPIRIIQLVVGIIVFVFIMALMIKKKTNASQTLVWMILPISALIQGIFPKSIVWIAEQLTIDYPPIIGVLLLIFFLLGVVFYLSSEVAVGLDKIRELSIQISLLNDEMRLVKERVNLDEAVQHEEEF